MSERKVLNKYYPPDFDPSKIPRMKLPKNRQYTVRLMAPFNMRCKTCGEYIYKGKKFNARKEDVENEEYLGIRIYRFYIKCTRCLQEISFKTDPRNTDYEIEAGATRNFMALKLAEEQAIREEEEAKEEEANNPMKLLENRTKQSKNEIELLESLEELKDLNRRQEAVDYDRMLLAYDTSLTQREREERLKQLDEDYIKTVKFQSNQKRKLVVEEEIVEDDKDDNEPELKNVKRGEASGSKTNDIGSCSSSNKNLIPAKSKIGSLTKRSALSGLVRIKKSNNDEEKKLVGTEEDKKEQVKEIENKTEVNVDKKKEVSEGKKEEVKESNALMLLGAYSDSENSEND